jgi:hypothetical protein
MTRTTRTLLLSLVVALCGCQARTAAQFASIQPGMNEQQVLEHLGQPSSRLKAPEASEEVSHRWAHRWHWGDTLSTSLSNSMFPDQPPPPTLGTIWFDADGRVLAVQAPMRADSPEATGPIDPWAELPR